MFVQLHNTTFMVLRVHQHVLLATGLLASNFRSHTQFLLAKLVTVISSIGYC